MSPHDQHGCEECPSCPICTAVLSLFNAASLQQPVPSRQPQTGAAGGLATGGRMLCRERCAATAGLLCVRIDEHEALLHQRFLIIQRQASEVDERLRIHKDANIAELKNAVALTRLC